MVRIHVPVHLVGAPSRTAAVRDTRVPRPLEVAQYVLGRLDVSRPWPLHELRARRHGHRDVRPRSACQVHERADELLVVLHQPRVRHLRAVLLGEVGVWDHWSRDRVAVHHPKALKHAVHVRALAQPHRACLQVLLNTHPEVPLELPFVREVVLLRERVKELLEQELVVRRACPVVDIEGHENHTLSSLQPVERRVHAVRREAIVKEKLVDVLLVQRPRAPSPIERLLQQECLPLGNGMPRNGDVLHGVDVCRDESALEVELAEREAFLCRDRAERAK
mmetsp:Transcript_18348/g.45019  ORF Transcript_18348/g.45019 Transcript_18348/m.45019 type:complete len:278 (-) Transcript_18348:2110-2943(-)